MIDYNNTNTNVNDLTHACNSSYCINLYQNITCS